MKGLSFGFGIIALIQFLVYFFQNDQCSNYFRYLNQFSVYLWVELVNEVERVSIGFRIRLGL